MAEALELGTHLVPDQTSKKQAAAGRSEIPKMSFASVAAMAPPSNSIEIKGLEAKSLNGASDFPISAESPHAPMRQAPSDEHKVLTDSLRRLDVNLRHRLDDEKTHLSMSSTTAPSVRSGTTFAMDEKESIRPDDSASVKAAEDDDSNSGPASRYGSEAGSKGLQWARRTGSGLADELRRGPLSSPNPLSVGVQLELPRPEPQVTAGSMVYHYQDPDEKLLEAMDNPKDRLFLLQLEKQVIAFIQDSSDPLLDLPPCNSFYRLLAHRLGDYYALSHFVDNSVSAVRLFRTPFCRLRTPLGEIAQKLAASGNARPIAPSMKIMRRRDGSTEDQAPSSGANTNDISTNASKAASEAGDEGSRQWSVTSPEDSNTARDKPAISREEREAKYREARERIFADYKEAEKSEPSLTDDGMPSSSRASSTTSRRKKKNNRVQDDGFDSRSSYNLYYPNASRAAPFYDQTATAMGYYNPYMPASTGSIAPMPYQPYGQYAQMPPIAQMPGYQCPAPQFPMMNMPGYAPAINSTQYSQYPPQARPPYFAPGQQPHVGPMPPHSMPSPALSNHSSQSSRPASQMSEQQPWGPTSFGYPNNVYGNPPSFQQQQPPPPPPPPHPAGQPPNASPMTSFIPPVPYAYGQLPFHPNGQQGSRPMHPIPGSYNRLHFNPQSKVFVPGQSTGMEASNVQKGPAMTHTGFVYPKDLSSPVGQQGNTRRVTGGAPSTQQPSTSQSTISKWATPPTLPPKPPPPAPATGPAGGDNMEPIPTFHNGSYTRPTSKQ